MPFHGGRPSRPLSLEGVPMWVYGSSFTVEPPFLATAGTEFHKLAAARLRMGTVTSFGVNGKSIREAAKRVVGGMGVANAPWTPTRRGIGVIDTWVNDLAAYAAGPTPRAFTAKDISGIRANLAAALCMMSSMTVLENTVGVKGGTWAADGAATDRSGGNNSISASPGATMTWEGVVVPETHFFFLGHTLEPNSFAIAPIEVLVDGQVARTITASEQQCHALVEGGSVTTGNGAWRIPCTPGTHTVAVRHAGAAATNMLVDAIVVPRPVAKRSPVFVLGDSLPRPVAAGAFYKTQGQVDILAANWPLLMAVYNDVLADFPNAYFVPSSLRAAEHYGADGLHPNDRGMGAKADELVAAISNRLATRRPDNLYSVV